MMCCIMTCHSVFPSYNKESECEWESTSSDELAFIQFAESIGYILEFRTQNEVAFSTPLIQQKISKSANKQHDPDRLVHYFLILKDFKFSSDRQRQSVVLKYTKSEV